ncbi:type I methionyl aminopeptidase [Gehongia tenuis]|uniref:Methionine aminopeptidase n=1 Tax=Gehongia tenuis TaxID=2763655 RepID=A0A926HPV0_9FIRM|nr:type I methionyl aminopeptidase [Gehongia tenuis]MBC8531588.1 type I methionyl aminopeptidase [Gehongia tenuis]
MITLKTDQEIAWMREAGRVVAGALEAVRQAIRPGVTTAELDRIGETYILSHGARPSFKGYQGFPAALCVSVNDEIVHGIPGDRMLEEGDMVSLDVGAELHGYHGDAARTYGVGEVDAATQQLMRVTEECFWKGIEQARVGSRLSDVSHAIQVHAESFGYSVPREITGHGIGRNLHEDPTVPNYGRAGHGERLKAGMTLAVEPMIAAGRRHIEVLDNDWTIVTVDQSRSAHYENTILITEGDPVILTAP